LTQLYQNLRKIKACIATIYKTYLQQKIFISAMIYFSYHLKKNFFKLKFFNVIYEKKLWKKFFFIDKIILLYISQSIGKSFPRQIPDR